MVRYFKPYTFPVPYTPKLEDKQFGEWAAKLISRIIASGDFVPMPIKLWPGGLSGVFDGFKYMTDGKVRVLF